MHRNIFWALVSTAVLLVASLVLAAPETVQAGEPLQAANPGAECVTCHSTPGLGMRFSTGEVISVFVDPSQWQQSVHGEVLQCTACHANTAVYPHQGREVARPAPRDVGYLTRSYASCGACHQQEYEQYLGSSHAQELRSGNADSAVCSDCHGSHNIEAANADRNGLSIRAAVTSCASCHLEEFEQYQNSVHGKALLVNGDPDVPACVDCHGVHAMGDPTLPGFRRQSPSMCASCHADEAMMKDYGLSTNIMDTYVADFHGTTVNLINAASEPLTATSAPTEAMCYDCHGVHEIRSMIDPKNPASSNGLVTVCRECHEDAPDDFPAAWLGHRKPAPDRFPLVYWIQHIYTIVIGATIVVLVGHIGLDFGKITSAKLREQTKRRKTR